MRIGNLNSKNVVALILALLLVILAGCSGASSSKTEQSSVGASTSPVAPASANGPKSFKLWLPTGALVNNNSVVQKYWKEVEPGVEVIMESTQGDALTSLNLKLNTGGFEDAAFFGRNDTVNTALIKSGTILPLEQYFEMPEKYPNLAAIPKAYLDQMKDKDGHIWSIPVDFDQNPDDPSMGWPSLGWYVRTDILEKVGMKMEDLSTIEGVENYLRKAAEQKDASGKPLLPLGLSLSSNNEKVILSTFGVKTAAGSEAVPVKKMDNGFMFWLDDPQYKAAFQWMNKMYRDKLLDPEVTVDKSERYQEKNKAGRYALNATSFFNMNQSIWESLDGPTEPGWYYEVINFPKVKNVEKIGTLSIVNPYPGSDIYISKNTKNLDAILTFFNYSLQQKEEMPLVITEGPVGLHWDWIDKPYGTWKFTDDAYKKARNSGDEATRRTVSPELSGLASYGKWNPWLNVGEYDHAGFAKTPGFSEALGKMGGIEKAHSYDLVTARPGGLWEKYKPELESVRSEYRAKLIMSKNDKEFESNWDDFRKVLEKRAHWSELKQEWNEDYQTLIKEKGEF